MTCARLRALWKSLVTFECYFCPVPPCYENLVSNLNKETASNFRVKGIDLSDGIRTYSLEGFGESLCRGASIARYVLSESTVGRYARCVGDAWDAHGAISTGATLLQLLKADIREGRLEIVRSVFSMYRTGEIMHRAFKWALKFQKEEILDWFASQFDPRFLTWTDTDLLTYAYAFPKGRKLLISALKEGALKWSFFESNRNAEIPEFKDDEERHREKEEAREKETRRRLKIIETGSEPSSSSDYATSRDHREWSTAAMHFLVELCDVPFLNAIKEYLPVDESRSRPKKGCPTRHGYVGYNRTESHRRSDFYSLFGSVIRSSRSAEEVVEKASWVLQTFRYSEDVYLDRVFEKLNGQTAELSALKLRRKWYPPREVDAIYLRHKSDMDDYNKMIDAVYENETRAGYEHLVNAYGASPENFEGIVDDVKTDYVRWLNFDDEPLLRHAACSRSEELQYETFPWMRKAKPEGAPILGIYARLCLFAKLTHYGMPSLASQCRSREEYDDEIEKLTAYLLQESGADFKTVYKKFQPIEKAFKFAWNPIGRFYNAKGSFGGIAERKHKDIAAWEKGRSCRSLGKVKRFKTSEARRRNVLVSWSPRSVSFLENVIRDKEWKTAAEVFNVSDAMMCWVASGDVEALKLQIEKVNDHAQTFSICDRCLCRLTTILIAIEFRRTDSLKWVIESGYFEPYKTTKRYYAPCGAYAIVEWRELSAIATAALETEDPAIIGMVDSAIKSLSHCEADDETEKGTANQSLLLALMRRTYLDLNTRPSTADGDYLQCSMGETASNRTQIAGHTTDAFLAGIQEKLQKAETWIFLLEEMKSCEVNCAIGAVSVSVMCRLPFEETEKILNYLMRRRNEERTKTPSETDVTSFASDFADPLAELPRYWSRNEVDALEEKPLYVIYNGQKTAVSKSFVKYPNRDRKYYSGGVLVEGPRAAHEKLSEFSRLESEARQKLWLEWKHGYVWYMFLRWSATMCNYKVASWLKRNLGIEFFGRYEEDSEENKNKRQADGFRKAATPYYDNQADDVDLRRTKDVGRSGESGKGTPFTEDPMGILENFERVMKKTPKGDPWSDDERPALGNEVGEKKNASCSNAQDVERDEIADAF
jgi:hypothetical protein